MFLKYVFNSVSGLRKKNPYRNLLRAIGILKPTPLLFFILLMIFFEILYCFVFGYG